MFMTEYNTDIERRTVLKTIAAGVTASFAGCTAMGGGPKYDPDTYGGVNTEALMLDVSAFPDGWKPEPDANEHFMSFTNSDGDVLVMLYFEVFDDVESAEVSMDDIESKTANPNSYDLADACFWEEQSDHARLTFRDSNAVAQVLGSRQSGMSWAPDIQRATTYAEALHTHWESVVEE